MRFTTARGLEEHRQRIHSTARVIDQALTATRVSPDERARTSTRCGSKARTSPRFALRREAAGINFRYTADGAIGISVDETTTVEDASDIVSVFSGVSRGTRPARRSGGERPSSPQLPRALLRTTPFLTHPVFNTHHSETQDDAVHPQPRAQGRRPRHVDDSARLLHDEAECRSEMHPGDVAIVLAHPSVRAGGAGGRLSRRCSRSSAQALCQITGFAAVSLQPNSGAQGEFAGLMAIRAYHRDRGEAARNVVLIPACAHGTNPASASMAGLKVVVVACDSQRLHRPRRPPRQGAASIGSRSRR